MVDERDDSIDESGEPGTEIGGEPMQETDDSASSNRTPLIIGAIVIAFLILVGLYLFLRGGTGVSEPDKAEEVIVSVKAAKAERDSITSEVSALGTVAPAEQSTVSSSISAQIVQMRLLKNAFVQKGEVLAVLASQDLRAQRDEAEAVLNEAKLNLETLQKVTIPQAEAQNTRELADARANVDNSRAIYERRKDLYEKGGISLKELEASQLAYTNAQNAYRLAQQNTSINRSGVNPNSRAIAEAKIKQAHDRLNAIQVQANRAEIRAPISGVVTEQFQFEGEFASPGAKLLTISDVSQVIVKAQISDTVVASLKNGDAVSVYPSTAPDEVSTGSVTLISRSGDPQNRTVEVWARFGNPRGLLNPGGAVQFVISRNTIEDAIVIPLAAVTLNASNADEGTVMIVGIDSVAHEKKVKVGIKQGDKVQIVEGLNGGETVVVEGNYGLPDGTRVEVAADDETSKDKG